MSRPKIPHPAGAPIGDMLGATLYWMSTAAHECRYVSVAEAARMLGLSEASVRRHIAAGDLPAVQLGGARNAVRVPRSAIESPVKEAPHG